MRARLLLVAALVLACALAGCEKIDRNMWDNPAFRPQEEPVRLPPADSVPTKGISRVPPMGEAAGLKIPVAPSDGARLEGKTLYGIHCAPCHGDSGAGDGLVGKKYVPAPADVRAGGPFGKLPDGVLFVIISDGLGGMPPFRADLSPDERWKIVIHLRALR